MVKPNLVFLSPVMPAYTSNGTSMRVGAFIEAFASTYDIVYILIDIYRRSNFMAGTQELLALCKQVEIIANPEKDAWLASSRNWLFAKAQRVDRIHVFRLPLAPHVKSYLLSPRNARAVCTLDMDDYESKSFARTAALHQASGEESSGQVARTRAEMFTRLEDEYVPRFDAVYVCQQGDRQELAKRFGAANIQVAPNVVRLPRSRAPKPPHDTFTFLFVGIFTYYPNQDAAAWFCSEVLPIIKNKAAMPVRVVLVGSQVTPEVEALARFENVTVAGEVRCMDPFYAQANVAVVPIRAGGGTRVKILEAFSQQCPVVATSLGAEGLDVQPGQELLLADTANDFADACLSLMQAPQEANRIAMQGWKWVSTHHTTDQLRAALMSAPELLHGGSSLFQQLDYPFDALPLRATYRTDLKPLVPRKMP